MTCRPTWKPASPSAATLTSRLLPLSCPRQDNKLLDIFRCKDKNLSNKIKNLLGLLSDGGLSIHELAKLCVQLELGQVRQEVNRRLANKEEELNNTRKNHSRIMEYMQAFLGAQQGRVF